MQKYANFINVCTALKMLSNAYILAKFRFDEAENEPANFFKILQKIANFATLIPIGVPLKLGRPGGPGRVAPRPLVPRALGLRTLPNLAVRKCIFKSR